MKTTPVTVEIAKMERDRVVLLNSEIRGNWVWAEWAFDVQLVQINGVQESPFWFDLDESVERVSLGTTIRGLLIQPKRVYTPADEFVRIVVDEASLMAGVNFVVKDA